MLSRLSRSARRPSSLWRLRMVRAPSCTGEWSRALSRKPWDRNSLRDEVRRSVWRVRLGAWLEAGRWTYEHADGFFKDAEYFEVGVGGPVEQHADGVEGGQGG